MMHWRIKIAFFNAIFLFALIGIANGAEQVPSYQPKPENLVDQVVQVDQYEFNVRIDPFLELEPLNLEIQGPRVIHFYKNRMFIGSSFGKVYWFDPPYTEAHLLLNLEGYPHSVVIRDGKIYIARTNDILVAEYSLDMETIDVEKFTMLVSLPGGRGHSSRTLKLGPDNRLYVSLGITANCSDQWLDNSYPEDDRRGGLFVIDESQSAAKLVPFASGLRNPVGFDWINDNSAIYASNNGPDHLGFHSPPEQFVRITDGANFGAPWFQFDGGDYYRDHCISSKPPFAKHDLSPPEALFPARNAPMDVAFIPNQNTGAYQKDAIVALHGSWATADAEAGMGDPKKRREPGIVRVEFAANHAVAVHDLVQGFQLPDGQRWARPMGVAIGPDGHIYFTSDGGIHGLYRLRWK